MHAAHGRTHVGRQAIISSQRVLKGGEGEKEVHGKGSPRASRSTRSPSKEKEFLETRSSEHRPGKGESLKAKSVKVHRAAEEKIPSDVAHLETVLRNKLVANYKEKFGKFASSKVISLLNSISLDDEVAHVGRVLSKIDETHFTKSAYQSLVAKVMQSEIEKTASGTLEDVCKAIYYMDIAFVDLPLESSQKQLLIRAVVDDVVSKMGPRSKSQDIEERDLAICETCAEVANAIREKVDIDHGRSAERVVSALFNNEKKLERSLKPEKRSAGISEKKPPRTITEVLAKKIEKDIDATGGVSRKHVKHAKKKHDSLEDTFKASVDEFFADFFYYNMHQTKKDVIDIRSLFKAARAYDKLKAEYGDSGGWTKHSAYWNNYVGSALRRVNESAEGQARFEEQISRLSVRQLHRLDEICKSNGCDELSAIINSLSRQPK